MSRTEAAEKLEALMEHLVRVVATHAQANYERDGWDFIVECWSDAEYREAIGPRTWTEAGAIRKVAGIAKLLNDRRQDIRATAF